MRIVKTILFALILSLSQSSCAANPVLDPNFQLMAETTKEIAASEARKAEADRDMFMSMASACNGDPMCVSNVAQQATIGRMVSGNKQLQAPAYTPRRTFWQELGLRVVGGMADSIVPGAVNWRQSDNNARVAIAQSGDQRAILVGSSQAVAGTAQAFVNAPWLNTPSYTVNGHMSQGPMNIGDQTDVGGSQYGDGSTVGDWEINRDNIDLGGGIFGDGNRQNSNDDNSDNSDNSDNRVDNSGQCQGTECQGGRRGE